MSSYILVFLLFFLRKQTNPLKLTRKESKLRPSEKYTL